MHIFSDAIKSYQPFRELRHAVLNNNCPCSLTGVSSIHKAQIILAMSEDKPVLTICEDEATSTRMCNDINEMCGQETAVLFPAKDINFVPVESISREYEYKRVRALSRILSGNCRIIVASAEACVIKTIPPKMLSEKCINISVSDNVDSAQLVTRLINSGYTRAVQVEGQSQFAVRGSIIDVFPVASNTPVRIELWGDDVDTISLFDIETQRRTETLQSISISPALEILFDEGVLKEKIQKLIDSNSGKKGEKINKHLYNDLEMLESGITLSDTDKYISLAYERPATVFDYFKDGFVCFSEHTNINEKLKGFQGQLNEDIKLLFEDGILFKGLDDFCLEPPQLFTEGEKLPCFYLDVFMRGSDIRFKQLLSANPLQTATWSGDMDQLVEDLSLFCERGYCTIVMAGSEKTVPIIVNDLKEKSIPAVVYTDKTELCDNKVIVMPGSVSGGYEYPEIKQALITQAKAMTSKRKVKKRKKGEEIRSISDINEGDLVVHSMYGIGRFAGISKIETQGITKDYITIKFAGTDVLYVPVNQLDLVSRYIGPRDDSGVKLNKLNSAEWQKTRAKVRSAVKDIAAELIRLYAKRQESMGFAFSQDNEWQKEFEERFDYTETDDQLRSIEEIKHDMISSVPMDRLLCGDVGFGKTEVALRAAFKCILDSKQCAILVPTTVLAWQHYQTAIKRFDHFPVNIQLLSRFRTPKQQAEIIRQLKRGEIDLIIGTHRLVQKDVEFKNLGLVIIDEEQRFGVAHKEKFKEVFTGVDVLTLSATPIPRTLNMAMSGIRDMSVIEEPPQDRHPVQTYVIEHNQAVLTQAIMKELRRGGQVYYIHNRVETIEGCVFRLQNALPEARIGIAHGKMGEAELSEVWRKLLEHEIDILVCTTLIETGVDVPNCNTLIIEDADRLGLSQLYQLRGRVGRSNRRAFAYFTFRRGKVLTDIASKRLTAIREFTQFGSGFRIAMRDLEIRGAGSILSGKQHGHMESVGYDMYIRLLSEAIAKEKGEEPPRNPESCLVDVAIDAFIPDSYIENLSLRIEAYRHIANIQSKDDSMDIMDELIDRYGEPPKSVTGLISVALMRNTAASLGITEISQRGENLLFYIAKPSMEQIKELSSQLKGRVLFNSMQKPYICVKLVPKQKAPQLMEQVLDIMSKA